MLSYKNYTRNENSFALTAFFFEYNYKGNYCFVEHCYFLCVQCAVIVDVDIVFYINKPERYGYEIFRFVFFFYNVVVEKQMSEQLIWLLFYKVLLGKISSSPYKKCFCTFRQSVILWKRLCSFISTL